jgi:hypothetical protein
MKNPPSTKSAITGIVFLLVVSIVTFAQSAYADAVKIVNVEASKQGDSWHFDVTLRHNDTGWDHYADEWRVVNADGKVLGDRVLYHPHENEQPFTRGLSGVKIPADIKKVYVEAHCKVDGWAKQKFEVTLK